jgi:hypothetical protein
VIGADASVREQPGCGTWLAIPWAAQAAAQVWADGKAHAYPVDNPPYKFAFVHILCQWVRENQLAMADPVGEVLCEATLSW